MKRDYVHSYCSNNTKTSEQEIHSILIVVLYTLKKDITKTKQES